MMAETWSLFLFCLLMGLTGAIWWASLLRRIVVRLWRRLRPARTQKCDRCNDQACQVVADATKTPTHYSYLCRRHMCAEGPFPAPDGAQQKGLE